MLCFLGSFNATKYTVVVAYIYVSDSEPKDMSIKVTFAQGVAANLLYWPS